MTDRLPAEQFAQEIRRLIATGGISVEELAASIDVHPQWLGRVMRGEVEHLTLLTVLGICRKLHIVPEDIWDTSLVAQAFDEFPPDAFTTEEGA